MADTLKASGVVTQVRGNNKYDVTVQVNDKEVSVLCYLSGKMCQHKISVIAGDQVEVVIPPPYNLGRITFRGKKAQE